MMRLANSFLFCLAVLMGFALVLNREGTWVPSGNENIYFLYLFKAWHPHFLANDFTFQEPTAGHPVFNYLFGWPTLFMSLEMLGWIGRVCSWAVLFTALMRIGRHFQIDRWLVALCILVWMIQRQSFVANEWIIGTFEAKCVAYSCFLFAIDLILSGGTILPGILIGLTFTFHSAVGLWGGAAVGLAFLMTRPIRDTVRFASVAILFALPGLISSWGMMFGGHPILPAEAKFIVTIEMPFHLDPKTFGSAKILVLYLMLAFDIAHYLFNRDDQRLGFLVRFQIFAGAFFLFGVLMRRLEIFTIVQLFPFRVYAVTQMLFFFWHLSAAIVHRKKEPMFNAIIAFAIFVFLCLPSPVARLTNLASDQLPKWKPQQDDFLDAAAWVRQNTPEDAIVIAPPWRKDTFYRVRRPLIADWHTPCFIAMTQWRERIESLVGDVSNLTVEENLAGEMDQRARDHYFNLSTEQVQNIVKAYSGDILISTKDYNLPVLHTSGVYKIYHLSR